MLDKLTIQSIVNQLRIFEPKKVILFGSHASGMATKESDIDGITLYSMTLKL